jgi:hypothetical protein
MGMSLITQNSKLKSTSREMGLRVFNFGIPAYKSATGKLTCPFADKCVKYCYAQKGAYIWGNVKPAFERRYEATKQDNFVEMMVEELVKKKADYLRIHDSGDYYSNEYIYKWFAIANALPHVRFYSYTKSIPLFLDKTIPENMDIIFSEGSKKDELIDVNIHRHSRIFSEKSELENAGYVDASKNDLMATKWFNDNHRIGLIFH